jgi:16S rRNA processing protein RimM
MSKQVCMGVIVGVHGVRGTVRLKSFAENEVDALAYGPLEDEAGKPYVLTLQGQSKGSLLVRIKGVGDRNAAEALKGVRLYVPRAALPPPAVDEFYHADLVGMRVELLDGAVLGVVLAVYNFGAGDLIDVQVTDSVKTVLLPFNRETVTEVDLAGWRLVVDPMPGLLDDGENDEAHGGAPDGESGAGR